MDHITKLFRNQTPPVFDATPQSIIDDAQAIIDTTTSLWDSLTTNIKVDAACFENTIQPIVDDENAKSKKLRILRFYASVSPFKELRDASNTAITMLNDAEVEWFSRQEMFFLISSAKAKASAAGSLVDEATSYYLEKLLERFLVNGCGISEESTRDEFKDKTKRLNDLIRECNKNFTEEKTGLWLTRDELEGVPESTMRRLKQGTDEHEGELWLPTKVPFSSPAITNAKSETTRKRIYYAVVNRMPKNVSLFREIVLLRDETARLLGFSNHMTFKTAQKMVKSPQTVEALLSEIRTSVIPLAGKMVAELHKLKQDETIARDQSSDDVKFFFWDMLYFSKKAGETKRLADATLSEYFELNQTLAKLLIMFEHLFGAKLISVNPKDSKIPTDLLWHDDVRMFSVWTVDEGSSEFEGYAYLDLFTRDGKFSHSGHILLQPGFENSDGRRSMPCSTLVMNYNKPPKNKPTLLSLEEVRKLFHELGHLFHGVLSRSKFAALHRVNGDFVEAPSMMLEQFFWEARIIQDVSFHYSYIDSDMETIWNEGCREMGVEQGLKPPPKLSYEQATKLADNNYAKNIRDQLKELFFTTFDILIHSPATHEELEKTNLTELFNKTRASLYQMHGGEALGEGWEWGHGESVFRNVVNGYDGGYYSYILGRVFALNIWEAGFKQDTLNKENGRRYRDMVLRKGGSQPEMKTLTDYLGHEPTTKPYLTWLGETSQ